MVQRRHGAPDIVAPAMGRALVVPVISVGAAVLTGASGQALAVAEDTGEALPGVEFPRQGGAGNISV